MFTLFLLMCPGFIYVVGGICIPVAEEVCIWHMEECMIHWKTSGLSQILNWITKKALLLQKVSSS